MARGSFKSEKAAKVSGGLSGTFSGSVAETQRKGEVSNSAKADEWAKTVNKRDWESPTYQSDDPNATS